jgi:hypothetical protein
MKKVPIIIAALLISNFVIFAAPIKRGVRISYFVTDAQIAFADSVFDYVMTPFLSQKVRNSISHAQLLLYRSIQGTKEKTTQWDWDFINQHENMFCHSDSTNQGANTRILTKWYTYLMEGRDLVDSTAADAHSHWINYYAVTASTQVHAYDYDGLFIDSASHLLKPEMMLDGEMPWDYDPLEWRLARYAALELIKSYQKDKIVIFNGLHNGAGADSSLAVTDGGMWEDFAFDPGNGNYKGILKWKRAIDCMQKNRDSSRLVLVVKKPGLMQDMQARVFSLASYLLIENPNTVFTLSDYAYDTTLQYYPEFDIDLGSATGDFVQTEDTLFTREFENGLVIVNPSSVSSRNFTLMQNYYKIQPVGGGFVDSTGGWEGHLTYEKVKAGTINLPAVSALILKDTSATKIADEPSGKLNFRLFQNYPNPFNPTTTIRYSISPALAMVQSTGARRGVKVQLKVYNILGQVVATLVNKAQRPGNYSVDFNGSHLPGGLYFYTLRAGTHKQSKKMILLK